MSAENNNESSPVMDVDAVLGRDDKPTNSKSAKGEKKNLTILNTTSFLKEMQHNKEMLTNIHDSLAKIIVDGKQQNAEATCAAVLHELNPRITAIEDNLDECLKKVNVLIEKFDKQEEAESDSSDEDDEEEEANDNIADGGQNDENVDRANNEQENNMPEARVEPAQPREQNRQVNEARRHYQPRQQPYRPRHLSPNGSRDRRPPYPDRGFDRNPRDDSRLFFLLRQFTRANRQWSPYGNGGGQNHFDRRGNFERRGNDRFRQYGGRQEN